MRRSVRTLRRSGRAHDRARQPQPQSRSALRLAHHRFSFAFRCPFFRRKPLVEPTCNLALAGVLYFFYYLSRPENDAVISVAAPGGMKRANGKPTGGATCNHTVGGSSSTQNVTSISEPQLLLAVCSIGLDARLQLSSSLIYYYSTS